MRIRTEAEFRYSKKGAVAYFESGLLKIPGLVHAFCTRDSGVSPPPFNSLNFSVREGDSPENVSGNWNLLSAGFGIHAGQFFTLRQVHGNGILIVDSRSSGSGDLEYDAVASSEKGIALCVKTADCVPVLLADRNLKAVAAVHAGWRGTSLQIVSKMAAFLCEKFGVGSTELLVALGPAIGPCCYEVDSVVREAMSGPAEQFFQQTGKHGKWKLDLPAVNRSQLINVGLPPENISSSGLCTACRTDLFYSHRAEKKTGRQLNFIMIENK